jgi:hypothetical protein
MPRTKLTPELKRDLAAIRMRDVMDPKQHFKKDGRRNAIPEFSQVGTVIEGPTEFYSARLTRRERRRNIVEEVLASSEASAKFARRYNDIQQRKSSGRKGYVKKFVAKRKARR